MEVNIKLTHPDAVIPAYATKGSACFDLTGVEAVGFDNQSNSEIWRTGLSFGLPQGHAMLVFSRSGHGFKENTRLANCVGIVDADYRGEVLVKLTRDDNEQHTAKPGDRIAQAMILPISQVSFNVVEELSATERGDGGFGSTCN